jgi:hypothetical protein
MLVSVVCVTRSQIVGEYILFMCFIFTSSPSLPRGSTRNFHTAQLDLKSVYNEVNLGVRVEREIPTYQL